jgi:hypothetical protein
VISMSEPEEVAGIKVMRGLVPNLSAIDSAFE